MGKIYQGILGGMSSKVGSVVGASWKGVPVLRIYQPVVSNPKTSAQISVRTAFKGYAQLASLVLSSFIKPLWDRDAVRMSGYNAFMKANKENIDEGKTIYSGTVVASKGKMSATTFTATASAANGITATWDGTASSRYSLETDIPYLLAIDEDSNVLYGARAGASTVKRSTGSVTIAAASLLKAITSGKTVKIYLSFLRADGTIVSDSANVSVTAGA